MSAPVLSGTFASDIGLVATLSPEYLQEFCNAALALLREQVQPKMYANAAKLLGIDAPTVERSVQALAYVMLRAATCAAPTDRLLDGMSITFEPAALEVLREAYAQALPELQGLAAAEPTRPRFHSLDWRLQVGPTRPPSTVAPRLPPPLPRHSLILPLPPLPCSALRTASQRPSCPRRRPSLRGGPNAGAGGRSLRAARADAERAAPAQAGQRGGGRGCRPERASLHRRLRAAAPPGVRAGGCPSRGALDALAQGGAEALSVHGVVTLHRIDTRHDWARGAAGGFAGGRAGLSRVRQCGLSVTRAGAALRATAESVLFAHDLTVTAEPLWLLYLLE